MLQMVKMDTVTLRKKTKMSRLLLALELLSRTKTMKRTIMRMMQSYKISATSSQIRLAKPH